MNQQTEPRMFRGVIVPLVTPLAAQDRLDEAGLVRLVEHVIAGGVNGIFVLGTTGEAPSLSYRIRREVIQNACGIAAGRVPVLVGITDTAFAESIDLANYATEAGATAVVLATPYYFPTGQTELLSYVSSIVEQLPLPVMLYNMPSMTKIWFEIETLRELSAMESIVGVKDSSDDLNYFEQLIRLRDQRPDWSLLVGPEQLLAESLQLGGDGGVMGGANLFPRLFVDCFEAASSNCYERVEELSLEIDKLQSIYSIGKYASRFIKATKCGLSILEVCEDLMAEPFHHFLPPERKRVEEVLMTISHGDHSSESLSSSPESSVQNSRNSVDKTKRKNQTSSLDSSQSELTSPLATDQRHSTTESSPRQPENRARDDDTVQHISANKRPTKPHVLIAMAISQHAYFEGIARCARELGWHLVT
ncbi:MAG: dihydrodipicolinate synthase family protein, partial [Aeoliella sp.]